MKNSKSFLFAKHGLWVVRNILNFFFFSTFGGRSSCFFSIFHHLDCFPLWSNVGVTNVTSFKGCSAQAHACSS